MIGTKWLATARQSLKKKVGAKKRKPFFFPILHDVFSEGVHFDTISYGAIREEGGREGQIFHKPSFDKKILGNGSAGRGGKKKELLLSHPLHGLKPTPRSFISISNILLPTRLLLAVSRSTKSQKSC
eukprot:TRINITY_DN5824_c0_g1_i1.p2 TRINITY_DN5824_c0_g1~~TRINITY_DN5824_c0_g1_i1.p2  ORF type:complete len:127 (-),score=7.23 TRINITY_DN5824_c0_g1_i1:96-476(-)